MYFPTAGLDDAFVAAFADLESYSEDTLIFLGGDMNASIKNSFRYPLLSNLINKYQSKRTKSFHPTYHHSTGLNGEFDSDLDVLLYSDRV